MYLNYYIDKILVGIVFGDLLRDWRKLNVGNFGDFTPTVINIYILH